MYRQYEDPYEIEKLIERAEIEMHEAIAMNDIEVNCPDKDSPMYIELYEE